MSNSIDEIRRQIESLDDKIHDLLMKRVEVMARMNDLTRKAGEETMQPERDTGFIRRLLARHSGALPRQSVARIWRELCAAALLTQTARKVAVTVPDGANGLIAWDLAKDYFGSALPMQKVANPLAALSMVKEKDVAYAVMPWPENEQPQAWWRFLLEEVGERPMRIVARLPLGENKADNGNPLHKSLAVARVPYKATEADRSFIVLQLEHRVSRARIVDKAKALGMTPISLHSSQSNHPDYNDHLLEVSGYVGERDAKLTQLLTLLESDNGRAVFAGGYPVPVVYDEPVKPTAAPSVIKKSA